MGFVALLVFCYQGRGAEFDLPKAAFEAFVRNDTQKVSDLIMNESRYRALTKSKDVGTPATEYEKHIKEASARAQDAAHRSFRDLRRLLVASGFGWSSAKVKRLETIVRDGTSTKRAQFDPKSKKQRLDIFITIESAEKTIELHLDDCFYVDGARYLGDGFKLREWSGFELNEAVWEEIEKERRPKTDKNGPANGSQPFR